MAFCASLEKGTDSDVFILSLQLIWVHLLTTSLQVIHYSDSHPDLITLSDATRAIVFLGTSHRGSDITTLPKSSSRFECGLIPGTSRGILRHWIEWQIVFAEFWIDRTLSAFLLRRNVGRAEGLYCIHADGRLRLIIFYQSVIIEDARKGRTQSMQDHVNMFCTRGEKYMYNIFSYGE